MASRVVAALQPLQVLSQSKELFRDFIFESIMSDGLPKPICDADVPLGASRRLHWRINTNNAKKPTRTSSATQRSVNSNRIGVNIEIGTDWSAERMEQPRDEPSRNARGAMRNTGLFAAQEARRDDEHEQN
jgi:hypothetical protein